MRTLVASSVLELSFGETSVCFPKAIFDHKHRLQVKHCGNNGITEDVKIQTQKNATRHRQYSLATVTEAFNKNCNITFCFSEGIFSLIFFFLSKRTVDITFC